MRPELVVEIALDGVQRSTRYPGGVALRFARVRRYRDDKGPADADTIDTVQALCTPGAADAWRIGCTLAVVQLVVAGRGHRHLRRRRRRALRRHPAAPARHRRLHDLREVRRRRRHVARQHLSRARRATSRRTSTPSASSASTTGAGSTRRSRRSSSYFEDVADRYGLRPHLRTDTEITECRWDEDGARVGAHHRRRRGPPRRRRDLGLGQLNRPVRPRAARPRRASPARSSTRPAGTTTTTSPASASPSSAPARRPSSSCPRSPRRPAASTSSSARPNWIVPKPDRAFSPRAKAAFRWVPGLDRAYRCRHLGPPRAARGSTSSATRRSQRHGQEDRRRAPARAGRRSRSCGPRSRPTTRSAASGSSSPSDWFPTLQLPHVDARHRRHRPGRGRRHRHRRRHPPPGRHDHLRHRVPDHRVPRADGGARPRRACRSTTRGRAAPGPTSA